jgi:uncharacterized protein (TIGR02246 family)
MRRFFTTAVLAALAWDGSHVSLAATLTRQELLQAATDLASRYDATYATRDPAAMATVYAEDGVLVSPPGPIVRGREALRLYYAKRFAAGARNHRIKVLEVHVLGDGGYGINSFSVTVPQANGTLREEHGTLVTVYRHDSDGWHMSLVAPSVPETPANDRAAH